MSALEAPLPGKVTEASIYLACPLTGLRDFDRRQLNSDIQAVKRAIECETLHDRLEPDSWPLSVYAPFDHTAPWKGDELSPAEVYERNLDAVHNADALIVLAEKGGSAGVGQEVEWSIRLGLPILFLTAEGDISRQIKGAPGFVSPQSYNKDTATLESHVRNFLQRWKPLILDGPRRRASRHFRYEALTARLRAAWQGCADPTGVAAQVRVDVQYLELALGDPRYVAMMPMDTLISLARELDVSTTTLHANPRFVLPPAMVRALMAAAEQHAWSDDLVERLMYEGRAALERVAAFDLDTKSGWHRLRGTLDL